MNLKKHTNNLQSSCSFTVISFGQSQSPAMGWTSWTHFHMDIISEMVIKE